LIHFYKRINMLAMYDYDSQVGDDTNLDELVKTIENMLVENNKVWHDKMLALMKEKENNDLKVIKIVHKFKDATFNSQIQKTGIFDGNDARVATSNVANVTRNAFKGFVTPVLQRTAELKHAFDFFGKAITPPSLDGVGYDGAENRGPAEAIPDNNRLKIIEEDYRIYVKEKNDESLLAEVVNSEEKENTLDYLSRSKDQSSNVVDKKDGDIETIIDGENLVNNLSSQTTSHETKIIIVDMENLDDDKQELSTRDSSKKVVNENRLLIKPSDSFGNGITKDLTPGYISKEVNVVETSTPFDLSGNKSQVPGVFEFSSAKKSDIADTDDDVAEQSILSLMTFEEKKVYFAQKIKEEETAALKSSIPPKLDGKSPQPSSNFVFPRLSPLPANTLKANALEESIINQEEKNKLEVEAMIRTL